MMFEINAETIAGKVYLRMDDLLLLLEGSVKDTNTPPFNDALRHFIKELKSIEVEAKTPVPLSNEELNSIVHAHSPTRMLDGISGPDEYISVGNS